MSTERKRATETPPFWRDFGSYAASNGFVGRWNRRTTLRRHDGGLRWGLRVRQHDGEAELVIELGQPEANAGLLEALRAVRGPIEERFGGPLVWNDVSGRVRQRVAAPTHPTGWSDTSRWQATWDALLADMAQLEAALAPELDRLVRRTPRRVPSPARGMRVTNGLHRDVEQLLIEAEVLAKDDEGITWLDGRRAAVRATRGTRPQVGWECEIEANGRRTRQRRLADVYVVAEIAPDSNDIVRLRAWDAAKVRPLLRGTPDYGVPGNFGWTHGLELDLTDPTVDELGVDLTPRLW